MFLPEGCPISIFKSTKIVDKLCTHTTIHKNTYQVDKTTDFDTAGLLRSPRPPRLYAFLTSSVAILLTASSHIFWRFHSVKLV